MPLLVVLVGVPLIIWGERFPVNGGWGFDGLNYGKWAVNFEGWIFGKKMEAYYIGKVLPSGILHYTLRLFDVEMTRMSIVRAFQVYNLLVLTLAAFTWSRIARRLALSEHANWFGFVGLFVNFAILKSALYNPLTINPSGFLLGMGLFYAYLARNQILLVVICCLGAFTWPSLLPTGMILFVFPRTDTPVQRAPFGLNALAGFLAAVAALWLIDYFFFEKSYGIFNQAYSPHISHSFIYLSTAAALVFVFFSISQLLDARYLYRVSSSVTRRNILRVAIRIAIALALYEGARATYRHFGPVGPGPGLEFYYAQIIFGAVMRPLQFLVAHVVIFGPVIAFAVLRWRVICRRMQGMGPGLVLFMLTLLVQAISAQGRQLLPYLPFVVGFTALAWENDLPKLRLAFFSTLCFLYSKIWFPINAVELRGDSRQFPFQRFFMNHGPWMNATMYLAQGAAVLLTFLFLYSVFRERSNESEAAQ